MNRSNRRGLVILIAVIVFFTGLFVGPSVFRSIKMNKYQGLTEASVVSITEIESNVSSYTGPGVKITGYKITYSYTVEGEDYTYTESVKPNAETKKLFDSFSSGQNCFIEVKYFSDNPKESLIYKLVRDSS